MPEPVGSSAPSHYAELNILVAVMQGGVGEESRVSAGQNVMRPQSKLY